MKILNLITLCTCLAFGGEFDLNAANGAVTNLTPLKKAGQIELKLNNSNPVTGLDYDEEGNSENNDEETVVPFHVAYAISIHKAQGLEYKTVKVVISSEVDEMITHNIFYTAITRAKENLQIYWSPEVEKKILENFKKRNSNKDIDFLQKLKK